MATLTKEIIEAAIYGFEEQRRKISQQIAELRAMLPGESSPPVSPTQPGKPKRTMSAAGRRAIAEAQRKRWAVKRSGERSSKTTAKPVKKAKRTLSPEGRAAIVAALKKRWAAKKSAA